MRVLLILGELNQRLLGQAAAQQAASSHRVCSLASQHGRAASEKLGSSIHQFPLPQWRLGAEDSNGLFKKELNKPEVKPAGEGSVCQPQ